MTDPNSSKSSSNQQQTHLKGQKLATVPELDHKWKNRCRQSSITKCAAAATELVAIHQGKRKEGGGSGGELISPVSGG